MKKWARAELFNILRGIVAASALPNQEKRALGLFVADIEEREEKENEQSGGSGLYFPHQ